MRSWTPDTTNLHLNFQRQTDEASNKWFKSVQVIMGRLKIPLEISLVGICVRLCVWVSIPFSPESVLAVLPVFAINRPVPEPAPRSALPWPLTLFRVLLGSGFVCASPCPPSCSSRQRFMWCSRRERGISLWQRRHLSFALKWQVQKELITIEMSYILYTCKMWVLNQWKAIEQ